MPKRSPDWLARWLRRRSDPQPVAGAIALGDGGAAARGVPSKAALVDRARAAGIAVPDGFVIPDGATVTSAMRARVAELGRVAVRSAFGAEDGAVSSLAGHFETRLGVDAAGFDDAVAAVRASADRRGGRFRADVLVMRMVPATRAGVAFSQPGTYDDLVNSVDGLADGLVSGSETGEGIVLSRVEKPRVPWQRRLRRLLRDVRRELGDRDWDVEWADDGGTCWLVQVRPITAPPVRDERLTLANHAEILPALPSTLMTSVIAEAGPDLFAWYRRRVPGLPADRDFLYVVAGRPMINLSLLEDMLRHLGLPTALVAESIGGAPSASRPARPGRMLTHLPSLIRLGWAQATAVGSARRRRRRIAAIGSPPAAGFADAIGQLHDAYVGLVTGMFPLSSSIGPPLALLRRAGTLYEHAGRHRTVTTELADAVARLRRTHDAAELDRFLAAFGHRGVYESDIARPRYRTRPPTPSTGVTEDPGRPARTPPQRSWKGRLTWPLWALVRPPLDAREMLRHEAMRGFEQVRDRLLELADAAVARGAIPARDDLWLLTAAEVRSLDGGAVFDADAIDLRRRERDRLADLEVPHVVGRHEDPADWSHGELDAADVLTGLPLTTGSVTGRAWVLHEPADHLPDGYAPDTTVLVARSVDAGWVGTLGLVAAAVVEIGGDLSHGSILIREVGLPAVTNVAGATRRIVDGDRVSVRAVRGLVAVE